MSEEHRHLLDVHERRILCACEPCCAMRSGEDDLRPTGTRTLRLEGFELSDELWAQFQIPIGLAFFFVSDVADGVVALYPSPAGATECELYLAAWNELVAANPVLADLEPEVEALIVNRLADPPVHAIVPIDRCYELVGMIKAAGRGSRAGTPSRTRSRRSSRGCPTRGAPHERRGRRRRRAHRARVPGVRRRRGCPMPPPRRCRSPSA